MPPSAPIQLLLSAPLIAAILVSSLGLPGAAKPAGGRGVTRRLFAGDAVQSMAFVDLPRPGGYLGAIHGRTGFFLVSFHEWRQEILSREAQLPALAGLGYGVLGAAMVETASYVPRKTLVLTSDTRYGTIGLVN